MRTRDAPRGSYGTVLSILFAAGLIYTMLLTLLLPAVRTLARGLHGSEIDVTWVLTAYVLSGAVATPIVGRLGDMYGKKRALVCLFITVAAGTLVTALSTSLAPMVIGRLLAGVASGVFPLAYGIIRDEFDGERVATAIGVISVSVGIGTGAGVVLSGYILEVFSYHWLFWFPFAATVTVAVAAARWIPESPLRPGGSVDWRGGVLMAAGLLATLLAISEATVWRWGSPKTLGLLAGGLLILLVWIRVELATREPLIDMRTMALTAVWRTNLAAALFGFGMFAGFSIVPQFVEQPHVTGYGYGASVIAAGVFLLPATVMMALIGPLAGRIERAVGSKPPLVLGGAFGACGFVLIAASHTIHWHVYAGMTLIGIGLGLAFAAMPNLIVQAVPHAQTGAATAINTIARVVGGAVGIQICATIVAQHISGPLRLPAERGFVIAFWLCAAGSLGACVIAMFVPGRGPRAPGRRVQTAVSSRSETILAP